MATPLHVDGESAVERLAAEVAGLVAPAAAGVEDGERRRPSRLDAGKERGHPGAVGHVAGRRMNAAGQPRRFRRQGFKRVGAAGGGEDGEAAASQFKRHAAAEPGTRAGDPG